MVKVERSILINAPVEKVFDYMADVHSNVEFIPGMIDVRDIQETPGHVGTHFKWTYKMAGIKFDGETTVLEWDQYKKVVTESKGGIKSKWCFMYGPETSGSKLSAVVEYEVPVPVLGKLAEVIVRRQNEKELELALSNVKAHVEAP
jgi:ribosome-associated toxin RatA of RatAB toxin-antitoxin module